ncbi:MAG: hypothetical protein KAJ19_21190, partial [Gammaproteobacteria bacterium]|nr:hypothetical protein [Gammaproteobacteria bacterium]
MTAPMTALSTKVSSFSMHLRSIESLLHSPPPNSALQAQYASSVNINNATVCQSILSTITSSSFWLQPQPFLDFILQPLDL